MHHRRLRVCHGGGDIGQWISGPRQEETAVHGSRRRKNANEGEMNLQLQAENGHTGKSQHIRCTVQAAKVTRPLFSVGKICDNGIDVLFRKGYAVTIDAKIGKELTRHPRENGTYRFNAKLRAGEETAAFRRQGA